MRRGFEASSSLPSSSSPKISASASSSSSGSSSGGGKDFDQGVVELAEALAVFGGKGDRVAEAEAKSLVGAVAPREPLGLVRDDDDRLSGAPNRCGKMAVGGGDPGPGVDEEQDRVAVEKGRFRLRPHPADERLRIALFEPGCVDDGEREIGEPRLSLAPVAGDPRLVVDEREFPSNQPVE